MVMESIWLHPCFQAHDNVYISKGQGPYEPAAAHVLRMAWNVRTGPMKSQLLIWRLRVSAPEGRLCCERPGRMAEFVRTCQGSRPLAI